MQVLDLWQSITGEKGVGLRSPHAIAFNQRLDWHHVLGWPSHRPAPNSYDDYIQLKQQYPDKLIGHRTSSGQPYWFVGVDAVIVSEILDSKGEALSLERDEQSKCPRCAISPHHAAAELYKICTLHKLEVLVVDRIIHAGRATMWTQTCTPHQPYLLGAATTFSTRNGEVTAADGDEDKLVLHSTAFNLGLLKSQAPDMPCLLEAMAPSFGNTSFENAGASRKRLESLLLMPPAPETALAIQQAIRHVWQTDVAIIWKTIQSWVQVQHLISYGPVGNAQAVSTFAEILQCIRCALASLEHPYPHMQVFCDSLMQIATSKQGINRRVSQAAFVNGCQLLEQCIGDIVLDGSEPLYDSPLPGFLTHADGSEYQWSAGSKASMDEFLMYYEGQYASIFNLSSLPHDIYQQLLVSKAHLFDAVDKFFAAHDYCSVVDRGATLKFFSSAQRLSLYSAHMKTAALTKYADTALPAAMRLVPFDGDLGDSHVRHRCFLTQDMADAQNQYILAHEAAMHSFGETLNKAWKFMCRPVTSEISMVLCILMAKEFTEWGRLISSVADTAFKRKWTLPKLAAKPAARLYVKQMWPYWLDVAHEGCVKNDVLLKDEVAILSGPNMAGKSTFLRSLTAVSLLGNCGLPIPAAEGSSVPQYQSFMYRNFRGDSPAEGRSGFALEAREMAIVLRRGQSTSSTPELPRHFVCIDEFGKGTEDRHATALCAAILQQLDQGNFCGIFATHQHALFQDQLGLFPSTACEQPLLQRTTQLRTITESTTPMLDVLDAPRVCREVLQRACFKVLHGVNTNSLAFQVANLQGFSFEMIKQSVMWRHAALEIHNQRLDPASRLSADRESGPSRFPPGEVDAEASVGSKGCSLDQLPALSYIGELVPESLRVSVIIPLTPSCPMHALPDTVTVSADLEGSQQLPKVCADRKHATYDRAAMLWSCAKWSSWGAARKPTDADAMNTWQIRWGAKTESSPPYNDNVDGVETKISRHQDTLARTRPVALHGSADIDWGEAVSSVEATLQNVLIGVCGIRKPTVHLLRLSKGQAPGILFLAKSCVYVLLIWNPAQGLQYYVGETDNVRKRLAGHAAHARRRFNGSVHTALVAGLSHGEKSTAKRAEALTIQSLLRQLAIVAQFRQALSSRQLLRPGHESRSDLCRYLRARQWDVSKALALWQGRVAWEAGPQAAPPDVPFTDQELQLIQRFYPHFWHKTDKYELLGSLQLAELLKHVSMERLLKLHVLEMHKSVKTVYPACSVHAGREVYTCTTIICLKGIKLSNFTKDVRNFVHNVSMIDQNYHPERLGQLLVVNAPIVFKGLWNVISPWLEARTKRKIQVLSASSTPTSLQCLIPRQNLVCQLGGESVWNPEKSAGPWADAEVQRALEKLGSSTSSATAVHEALL